MSQPFSDAVREFKRRLVADALVAARGNRTHAARALGLQRTYLLRLLRQLDVPAPPSPASPEARRSQLHRADPP